MKIKFIDSKNRVRTILAATTPKTIIEDLIGYQSETFGPLFAEKMDEFVKTLPEKEVQYYKEMIALKADLKPEDISDAEVITYSSLILTKYLNWLDKTYPDNPDRLLEVDFVWDENLAVKQNNYALSDPRKKVSYSNIKNDYFYDLEIDDGEDASTDANGITTAVLLGTRRNLDILAEKLAERWNESLELPEEITTSSGKSKKVYSELSPSEFKELQKSKNELDKEELELLENPDLYTADDVKKVCFKKIELTPHTVEGYSQVSAHDSKDWFGVQGLKLIYNFENSKLVKDNNSVNYYTINKELEKSYYDSKDNISYEEWLSKNPNIILDTFNKLSKGENKPMNDSLKNLKFKFKDGIEIEVLDSEGKSFAEVKDEVIQVHRRMVEKQLKDSKNDTEKKTEEVLEDLGAKATNDSCEEEDAKETEKVLEDLGAKATNDSCEDVSPETQEKLDKAEINVAKDSCDGCEDSIEEEKDRYRVIVNGKEIGIYDTMEEAEEAEKKALEAVEKGIPKVEIQDDRKYEDDAEQAAYESARDCLYYGASKNDWNSCGLPEEKANEIWRQAFKDLAEEM